MERIDTDIKDLFIIKPKVYFDFRGCFFESYNKELFNKLFSNINFIQDNESWSKKGVLRGLHFQLPPYSQSKLVRVSRGKILDVVVDLRLDSKTFGEHRKFILSDKNKLQLFVPKGFAHGFLTVSEEATVNYKVDEKYSHEHDSGIIYNDKTLKIDWEFNLKLNISEKDLSFSTFNKFKSPF